MHARAALLSALVMGTGSVALFSGAELGCRALEPVNRPVSSCIRACGERAKASCSSAECERGCEFILDRLVERETDTVLACVTRFPRRCDDVVWAECAARVGPHVDGGPPAPTPLEDDD